MAAQGLPLVPLVVGITGHRDILAGNREALKRQVEEILTGLRSMYPYTPLVVLSALAEGADRLAADVAVALKEKDNDIDLIAVLPMRKDLYVTEFHTEESNREFAMLLDRAKRCVELPLCEGNDEDFVRNQGKPRDQQYEELGKYIADHSNILIALWDGNKTEKPGGTAHNVAIKRGEVVDVVRKNPLDPPEVGPVYHIVTPRRSNPSPEGKFTLSRLYPVEPKSVDNKMYDNIFKRIDDFNRDCRETLESDLAAKYKESKESLLSNNKLSEIRESDRSPETAQRHEALLALRDAFGAADALAGYFQAKVRTTTIRIYYGVAIGTALFLLAHATEAPPLALMWAVCLVSLVGCHKIVKSKRWENRYQDYRTLAEGLRVQFFWSLADLKRSVADNYLRMQRSELEWIRGALRWFGMPFDSSVDSDRKLSGRIREPDLFSSSWIKNQHIYFHEAAPDREEKHIRYRGRMGICLVLGVSIGLCWVLILFWECIQEDSLQKCLLRFTRSHGPIKWTKRALDLLPNISAFALAVAALFHSYGEKWAFSQQAKRYEKMSLLFESATPEEIRGENALNLIADLGKEALRENGDWLILHRERPLELPHVEGIW